MWNPAATKSCHVPGQLKFNIHLLCVFSRSSQAPVGDTLLYRPIRRVKSAQWPCKTLSLQLSMLSCQVISSEDLSLKVTASTLHLLISTTAHLDILISGALTLPFMPRNNHTHWEFHVSTHARVHFLSKCKCSVLAENQCEYIIVHHSFSWWRELLTFPCPFFHHFPTFRPDTEILSVPNNTNKYIDREVRSHSQKKIFSYDIHLPALWRRSNHFAPHPCLSRWEQSGTCFSLQWLQSRSDRMRQELSSEFNQREGVQTLFLSKQPLTTLRCRASRLNFTEIIEDRFLNDE